MKASDQLDSKDSLKAAIAEKFGSDARVHTCSADNMDAGALIEFLAERGKFAANIGASPWVPPQIVSLYAECCSDGA